MSKTLGCLFSLVEISVSTVPTVTPIQVFAGKNLGENFNAQFRNPDGRSFFILLNKLQQQLRRDPRWAQGHVEQPTAATLARRNTIETPRGLV